MEESDIRRFYEHLKENQLPLEVNQEAQGFGSKRYTADMWTLEVCECLLDMPCKPSIYYKKQKEWLFETLENVKQDADKICIGEVGRGLDIVIANMIKDWSVISYDHNPIYATYLDKYFTSVEFYPTSTHAFIARNEEYIKEKTIFIIDNTKCRNFEALKKNKNIVHLIFFGKLEW